MCYFKYDLLESYNNGFNDGLNNLDINFFDEKKNKKSYLYGYDIGNRLYYKNKSNFSYYVKENNDYLEMFDLT